MSGIRESDPCLHLGRVTYYHYTNPAIATSIILYKMGFLCKFEKTFVLEKDLLHGMISRVLGCFVRTISNTAMNQRNRNTIIFFVSSGVLILFAVIFFILPFFVSADPKLPSQFVESFQSASRVSEDIVSLTAKTNDAIRTIGDLDVSRDKEKIFSLIREAREANEKAYDHAFLLSQDLREITESLAGINSQESQRIAYDAIATELALVSEFIVYTQNLQLFLDRMSALAYVDVPEQRASVEEAIAAVNEKTRSINELNADFLSKMKLFEESL